MHICVQRVYVFAAALCTALKLCLHAARSSSAIALRVSTLAPSTSLKPLQYSKLAWHRLYQSLLLFKVLKKSSDICPTRILDGGRIPFASGSSLCFVVFLASGLAVDDVAADDVGVAAGFGVGFLVTLDLDLRWCVRIGK